MWPSKTKNISKWLFIVLVVLSVILVVSGCGKDEEDGKDPKKVLAVYTGGQVIQSEFEAYMGVTFLFNPEYTQFQMYDPNYEKNMLEQLITFKVLESRVSAAVKSEIEPQIKQQVNEVDTIIKDSQMKETIKGIGITADDIKTYIRRSMMVIGDAERKLTEESVKQQYNQKLTDNPNAYDYAILRHVLVGFEGRSPEEALKRANEAKDKLRAGSDFESIAKEYSDDPGSKDQGGQYPETNVNQWVEPFKAAALTLPLNEVSEPVETTYGHHVMKVEARSTKTYDQVKGQLKGEMTEKQIFDFIQNELPGLVTEMNLPAVELPGADAPAASPAAETPAK